MSQIIFDTDGSDKMKTLNMVNYNFSVLNNRKVGNSSSSQKNKI